MKITAEKNEESQYVVRIEVEPAELDAAKSKAVKRLSNRLRVPGFRPGKAPRVIVERMVGQEALIEEATRDILPKAYQEALENKDIKPIADPEMNIESINPLVIVAKIPVEPTVTLGDYRELRFEQKTVEIGEEEVDKAIEQIRERKTTWDDLTENRPAQVGDKIEISLQTIRDGEEVGEATTRTGELGKGEILEQLDEQIIGMTIDEEKIVEITRTPAKPAEEEEQEAVEDAAEAEAATEAPTQEEASAETATETEAASETAEVETIPLSAEEQEQQGLRPLTFKVQLKSIKVKNEPELNDEFAASASSFQTLAELRESTANDLRTAAENNAKSEVTEQMVKALVEQSKFEIPHVLIHSEADALEQNLDARLKQQKLNLALYLQFTGKSHEELHEEMHQQAEERLRTALALRQVAVLEGISVAGEELDRAVEKTVERYTSTLPEEGRSESAIQLRELFGSEESRRRLSDDIFSQKIAQRLLEIATGRAPAPGTPVILDDEGEAVSAPSSTEISEAATEETETSSSETAAPEMSADTAEETEEAPKARKGKGKDKAESSETETSDSDSNESDEDAPAAQDK